jgi:hypothetical protein
MDEGECLVVKNIEKPCAGEPQARFDEGGRAKSVLFFTIFYGVVGMAKKKRIT